MQRKRKTGGGKGKQKKYKWSCTDENNIFQKSPKQHKILSIEKV